MRPVHPAPGGRWAPKPPTYHPSRSARGDPLFPSFASFAMRQLKPKHSFVLLQALEKTTTILRVASDTPAADAATATEMHYFKVLEVGPGMLQDGVMVPPCVEPGDIVVTDVAMGQRFVDPDLGRIALVMDVSITMAVEGMDMSSYRPIRRN